MPVQIAERLRMEEEEEGQRWGDTRMRLMGLYPSLPLAHHCLCLRLDHHPYSLVSGTLTIVEFESIPHSPTSRNS